MEFIIFSASIEKNYPQQMIFLKIQKNLYCCTPKNQRFSFVKLVNAAAATETSSL